MTHERILLTDQMTVVLGFCELLLMNAYGPLQERHREVIESMTAAAAGARDIVRASDSGFNGES